MTDSSLIFGARGLAPVNQTHDSGASAESGVLAARLLPEMFCVYDLTGIQPDLAALLLTGQPNHCIIPSYNYRFAFSTDPLRLKVAPLASGGVLPYSPALPLSPKCT